MIIIPASAFKKIDAKYSIGVGPHPISTTSIPDAIIPLIKEFEILGLDNLPSLQTIIVFNPFFLLNEQKPLPRIYASFSNYSRIRTSNY